MAPEAPNEACYACNFTCNQLTRLLQAAWGEHILSILFIAMIHSQLKLKNRLRFFVIIALFVTSSQ